MSKRGLSLEEKKAKMLEIFHENSEFFTLKEMEKLAPKLKGIVLPTVKDVLNDLVSDGLVQCDKIGTGNCQLKTVVYHLGVPKLKAPDYWSFPSAAGAAKQNALDKAQGELDSVNAKLAEVNQALKDAQKGREDTPDRRKLLESLREQQELSQSLKTELAAFGAADPVKYERKKDAVRVAKEAAQRWTDNTLILMQFAQTLGAEEEQLRAMLGIDDTWDDLPM